MDAFWKNFFSFLEKILPIFGVYFGWRLGRKTLIKQLLLDNLRQKFDALRQIKSVIENIPSNLDKKQLIDKLNSDSQFCESLTGRLVRLFGLRNELIPFLESEFVDLLDKQLEPLFIIETGRYTFRKEKIEEFANFAKEARSLMVSIEKRLTEEYRNQLK